MTISLTKQKVKLAAELPGGDQKQITYERTPMPKKVVKNLTPMEYHSQLNGWKQSDFI